MEKEIKINIPEGYEIDKENSTFECIKFKKKNELPTTWEEYLDRFCGFTLTAQLYVNYLTNNLGQRYAALYKLELLRDCWRQGWKPDYNDSKQIKFGIYVYGRNTISQCQILQNHNFLTFNDLHKTEDFAKRFKDLIIQAEDLL